MIHSTPRLTQKTWSPLRQHHHITDLQSNLQTLIKYYNFVSLSDAVEMLEGSLSMPNNPMVLTADDGYRNNLTRLLPVVNQLSIPLSVFLSTSNVSSGNPYFFDRLDFAISMNALKHQTRTELLKKYRQARDEVKGAKSLIEYRNTIEVMSQDFPNVNDSTEDLRSTFEEVSSIMNEEEVTSAAAEIDFGSHTRNHSILTMLTPEEAVIEITGSKRDVEELTKKECKHFCYPNGEFSENLTRIVRHSGYRCAVSTLEGLNSKNTDLFALKRINLPTQVNPEKLLIKASGFDSIVKRLFHILIEH